MFLSNKYMAHVAMCAIESRFCSSCTSEVARGNVEDLNQLVILPSSSTGLPQDFTIKWIRGSEAAKSAGVNETLIVVRPWVEGDWKLH